MRYLGIDYGEKRIGVALSDPLGRIAFPKKVILNRGGEAVCAQLKMLLDEEKISVIIVGLPVGLDGKDTEITKKVRELSGWLREKLNVSVELENEMFTTHMVERAGVKKEHTDEAAAALILQSYLDRTNKGITNRV